MKRLKNVKTKNGFTLIEIIVVLVIIAILAAATVPSMVGFVGEARGKAYANDARVGLQAAQSVVSEVVGAGGEVYIDGSSSGSKATVKTRDGVDIVIVDSQTFKNMTDDVTSGEGVTAIASFSGVRIDKPSSRVTHITYENSSYRVILSGGSTEVERINK